MSQITRRDLGAFILGFDLALLVAGPERFNLSWTGDLRYVSALVVLLVFGFVLYRSEGTLL